MTDGNEASLLSSGEVQSLRMMNGTRRMAFKLQGLSLWVSGDTLSHS